MAVIHGFPQGLQSSEVYAHIHSSPQSVVRGILTVSGHNSTVEKEKVILLAIKQPIVDNFVTTSLLVFT